MAIVIVTVTPKNGGPRDIVLDDAKERDAEQIRTIRRQVAREELVSVTVRPWQEPTEPAKKVAKKAAPAEPATA